MEAAFWDTSAIVPLCVEQPSSVRSEQYAEEYSMVVWWATPVEVSSAFARLVRIRDISLQKYGHAQIRLAEIAVAWKEMQAFDSIRNLATDLVGRHPLTAADSLQLAAALAWTRQRPHNRPFICADRQLLRAAEQLGFRGLEI